MFLLQLLGGVSLVGDNGPLTGPATQRRRLALLARLAAAPDASVSRDKLIACFWPEDDRERARHFLADSVFTLRRALGKEFLRSAGDDLVLDPAAVSCDLWRFDAALREGRLEEAVTLYRGPFLDGFFIGDAPEFERWVEEERPVVAARHASALERLAEERERDGDHTAAATWWARLAARDPLSARVSLRLMRALAESGDRAAALRHAGVHAALLREELGLDPDPQVQALAAEIASTPGGRGALHPTTPVSGGDTSRDDNRVSLPATMPDRGITVDPEHADRPASVESREAGEPPRANPAAAAQPAAPPEGHGVDVPPSTAGEQHPRLEAPENSGPAPLPSSDSAGPEAHTLHPPAAPAPAPEPETASGGAASGPPLDATSTSSGNRPRRRRGRGLGAFRPSVSRLVPLLGLALLLSTAIWARRSRPEDAPAPRATPETTVAVLPFHYQGPEDEAYLAGGLATLLTASLDGAGELYTVDSNALLGRLADPAAIGAGLPGLSEAGEIAGDFGAGLFTMGSAVLTGDRLHLTVTLYEHAPRPAAVARATGEGRVEELSDLVERVSRQLLIERLPEHADRLARAALLAPVPFSALKPYLQGEYDFRASRYPRAAEMLQQAVAADPSFALAHYRLSMALEWSFRFPEARRAAREAVRHSGTLLPREQRLIVAWDRFVHGDAEGAESYYQAAVFDDDLDVEAWSGVGEAAVHYNAVRGERDTAAISAFREVLRLAPGFGEARFHLLEFAARSGDRERFDTLFAGVDPRSPQLLPWQAARAIAWEGSLPDSLAVKLEAAGDNIVAVAAVRTAIHFRDIDGAQALAQLLTRPGRPDDWRAAGQIMMAQGHFARGEWQEAGALLDSARAVAPEWALEMEALGALLPESPATPDDLLRLRERLEAWEPGRSNPSTTFFFATHYDSHAQLRHYLLALLGVRLGNDGEAERHGEMLRATGGSPTVGEQGRAWGLSVEAHRSWSRGDAEGAVRLLEQGRMKAPLERIAISPFFSQAPDRFLRAEALRELGRPEEALKWYASLTDSSDLLWWAAAHRAQAELLDELGRREEAAAHLRRLAALRGQ